MRINKRLIGLLIGGSAMIVHMLLRPIFGVEAHHSSIIVYTVLSWALILIAWEFFLRSQFIGLVDDIKKSRDKHVEKKVGSAA